MEIELGQKSLPLNVELFLKSFIKDEGSPYWKILDADQFEKVYAFEGKLVWENVIPATVCNGEVNFHDAVFSEKEIRAFVEL